MRPVPSSPEELLSKRLANGAFDLSAGELGATDRT
jgi:hypothetical protein